MKLSDLELSFEYVGSGRQYERSAYVRRSTGETFWRSDYGDEDELPEGFEEDGDFVEIPHKNDLDLGKDLVWRFVRWKIPDRYHQVQDIFSRRGAYGRYKSLLERIGLLDEWYEFEATEEKQALLEWCKENDIEVEV